MLSTQTIKVLIAGSLLLHGVAHAIALVAIFIQGLGISSDSRIRFRSWLVPSISEKMAAIVAIPFWSVSTIGFIVSAISFWGWLFNAGYWRHLAIGSSAFSVLGIVIFSGIWPGSASRMRSTLNTIVALAMNTVILVALLWLRWPPEEMFGN